MRYAHFPPAVVAGGGRSADVVGRLVRDGDAPAREQGRSLRAFHVMPDDGAEPLARVTTEQELGPRGGERPAVYRVDDGRGAPLGRVTFRRGRPGRFGRARWTVEPVGGPALGGYRGRLLWWAVWWPLGLPLSVVWAVLSLLGDGDDGFGAPRRVIWRDGSRRGRLVFRGIADEYKVRGEGLDPRLVLALIGLHQSFDPSDGAPSTGWYETVSAPSRGPVR
ncbi:hypothetical protein ACFWZ2_23685 [Streptomyces sp. NPDC059002]|uniref:hypothetical protein n=1 Tax=Streptomyces sp. NPDC059002 TaxID=3346690 RepID=UPI0036C15B3B